MLHEFLKNIGIVQEDARPPFYTYSPGSPFDPEEEKSPAYIKFQSKDISDVSDRSQADQFEVWLKERGYSFYRGYKLDLEVKRRTDRRFFLGQEATTVVHALVQQFGVSVVEGYPIEDYLVVVWQE